MDPRPPVGTSPAVAVEITSFLTEQHRKQGSVTAPADMLQKTVALEIWLIGTHRYGRLRSRMEIVVVEHDGWLPGQAADTMLDKPPSMHAVNAFPTDKVLDHKARPDTEQRSMIDSFPMRPMLPLYALAVLLASPAAPTDTSAIVPRPTAARWTATNRKPPNSPRKPN